MLDREKLLKILRLTASDQDGEALSAIRRANEILRREKLTWDQVISSGREHPPDTGFEETLRRRQARATQATHAAHAAHAAHAPHARHEESLYEAAVNAFMDAGVAFMSYSTPEDEPYLANTGLNDFEWTYYPRSLTFTYQGLYRTVVKRATIAQAIYRIRRGVRSAEE